MHRSLCRSNLEQNLAKGNSPNWRLCWHDTLLAPALPPRRRQLLSLARQKSQFKSQASWHRQSDYPPNSCRRNGFRLGNRSSKPQSLAIPITPWNLNVALQSFVPENRALTGVHDGNCNGKSQESCDFGELSFWRHRRTPSGSKTTAAK